MLDDFFLKALVHGRHILIIFSSTWVIILKNQSILVYMRFHSLLPRWLLPGIFICMNPRQRKSLTWIVGCSFFILKQSNQQPIYYFFLITLEAVIPLILQGMFGRSRSIVTISVHLLLMRPNKVLIASLCNIPYLRSWASLHAVKTE